jgi:hypothetical protein
MKSAEPGLSRAPLCAIVLLCAFGGVTLGAVAPRAAGAEPPKEWDGLQLRKSKRVQRLYVRPEASLAGYKRVRLARLQVAFDKDWDPNRSRTLSQRLTKEDLEKIRNALADEFAKTTKEVLQKGNYQVTEEAGPDVLDVTPFVVDLYITAPDKMSAGRSYTYAADPGHMTLVAELRDSETQQILARALDAQSTDWGGTFQITTSVTNMAAAQSIIARWARALSDALDAANGKE